MSKHQQTRSVVYALTASILATLLSACGGGGGSRPAEASPQNAVQQATAPGITTQPQSTTVVEGQTATFSVVADGTSPLTYQWSQNGLPIAGATGPTLTLSPANLADDGSVFSVSVSNAAGTVTSVNVVLSVSLPVPDTDRLAIASTHTVARRSDGTLIGWGGNGWGQLGSGPVIAGTFARSIGGSAAMATTAGDEGGALLTSAGTVEAWGRNSGGWMGADNPYGGAVSIGSSVPVAWPHPVVDISIGIDNFDQQDLLYAVLDDGSVWYYPGSSVTVGGVTRYSAAKVANLDGVAQLARGHSRDMRVVRTDGTVWKLVLTKSLATGAISASAEQVPGLTTVKSVNCGLDHCLALLQDGTVKAWGEGRYGQLGQGIAASSETTPVTVVGLNGVTHIAVTSNYGASFARTSDGKLWSWGNGNLSARPGVGYGPSPDALVPTEVTSLTGVREVVCSTGHCAARLADGSVWSWGDDTYQQLGRGVPEFPVWAQLPVKATGINLNQ